MISSFVHALERREVARMPCGDDSALVRQRSVACAFYLFIRQPHGSEVSPAARNSLDSAPIPTASKLLICGLFQKGRVLAQDGAKGRRLYNRLARGCYLQLHDDVVLRKKSIKR